MVRGAHPPEVTRSLWRSRRAAAVAGLAFAVLLIAAMVMMRMAVSGGSFTSLQSDADRRGLIRTSLNLVPFAGIAFLWFIGVVRDQLGAMEDRLFSTVFLGSGLLFLAMIFISAVTTSSLLSMVEGPNANPDVWAFGRSSTQVLVSVYAMRMAAVFTLSVSTVGMRTGAMPRWVSYLGYLVALMLFLSAGEQVWTQLLFPAWVLVVSLAILFTPPRHPVVDTVGEAREVTP